MPGNERDTAAIARFADELPAAIWVGAVPSGECVYVNREFMEILGFAPPPEATRGEYASSYGVFTRDGRPYPEDQMPYERVLRARATVVIDDLVVRRGPRPYAYLRVFARPLFDADGNITHVVEAFVDITREVDAEAARAESDAQLRHGQRMESLGMLAGGIAHDFNNALGALKLLGSQLSRIVSDLDPTAREIVTQMNDVTDSAARLTRSLLGFAQRTRQERARLVVNELVEAIAAIARRTIDRRITVNVDLTREATAVLGDSTQLEQVLLNLVLNARDAMAGNGNITLHTSVRTLDAAPADAKSLASGRYVVIDVIDTGSGIDAAIRDRVFEPYFTTKTGGPVRGTGLGLATAYGVLQRHAGAITVAATGASGTTMRMYLPALAANASADDVKAADEGPVAEPVRGRGTLLLVDDDPIVRVACAETLRSIGYDVMTADDGAAAIEVFRQHHDELSVVVLDLVMPGVGGREALAVMRRLDAKVPVIIATGSLLDDEARASLSGNAGILAKPFGPVELSVAVASAIAGRRVATHV